MPVLTFNYTDKTRLDRLYVMAYFNLEPYPYAMIADYYASLEQQIFLLCSRTL